MKTERVINSYGEEIEVPVTHSYGEEIEVPVTPRTPQGYIPNTLITRAENGFIIQHLDKTFIATDYWRIREVLESIYGKEI